MFNAIEKAAGGQVARSSGRRLARLLLGWLAGRREPTMTLDDADDDALGRTSLSSAGIETTTD